MSNHHNSTNNNNRDEIFSTNHRDENIITFALIPKTIDNPFFDVSRDGCMDQAERITKELKGEGKLVKCIYLGPTTANDVEEQVELIRSLISGNNNNNTQLKVDGIAVSAMDANALVSVMEEAEEAGIPVVTFDSDAPQTKRISYIGTDNESFGERLGKVLKQIQPEPKKTFRMVSIPVEPNILQRERGVRKKLLEEGWIEAGAPSNMKNNATLVVEQMFQFMQEDPALTAIVPVVGAGMRSPIWVDFVKAYPDVLLVVSDAMPNQLELLDRAYCNGLVGQLPYEMGAKSIQVLYDLYSGQTTPQELPEFIATNVLEHLRIPLTLPELEKDYNLVGELRYVGYTLFGLVAVMSIGFMTWAFCHRTERVVKVAQPQFLILVAVGSLLMCSAILPLGFDDASSQIPDDQGIVVCMTPMWLLIVGFSLTYSSLFAKIYRVNLVFRSGERFARVQMKQRELYITLTSLLLANGVILLSWTLIDPLKYIRLDDEGLDGWDRPISSYGTCQSENPVPYLIPLGLLNGILLLFANCSAYEARSISSEFAESKYVGMAMASLFQALISGVPVLFLVHKSPQAFYMVLVFMIFVISAAILLLIFVPKVVAYYIFRNQTPEQRRRAMEKSIRDSGRNIRRSSVFRYSSWHIESAPKLLSQGDEGESSPEMTSPLDINGTEFQSPPISQSFRSSDHENSKGGSQGELSESFKSKSQNKAISGQSMESVPEDVANKNNKTDRSAMMWDSSNKAPSMKSVSENLVTEKKSSPNNRPGLGDSTANKSISMMSITSLRRSQVMKRNQAMWNSARSLHTTSDDNIMPKSESEELQMMSNRDDNDDSQEPPSEEDVPTNDTSQPVPPDTSETNNTPVPTTTRQETEKSEGTGDGTLNRVDSSNDSIWSA